MKITKFLILGLLCMVFHNYAYSGQSVFAITNTFPPADSDVELTTEKAPMGDWEIRHENASIDDPNCPPGSSNPFAFSYTVVAVNTITGQKQVLDRVSVGCDGVVSHANPDPHTDITGLVVQDIFDAEPGLSENAYEELLG